MKKSLILWIFLLIAACQGGVTPGSPGVSGGTSGTSVLPSGQAGSLNLFSSNKAGCYLFSGEMGACNNPPLGLNQTTALSTTLVGSTPYVVTGDNSGNILTYSPNSTGGTYNNECPRPSGPITGLAVYSNGSVVDVYASEGGYIFLNTDNSGTICAGATNTINSSPLTGTIVGLANSDNGSADYMYGITQAGQYFSTLAGSSTMSTLLSLPGIPGTVTLTSVTSDKWGYVYVTDTANGGAIYVFYSNAGALQLIKTITSADISSPIAITTFVASNGTQTYCTTGPCEFIDIANSNGTVVQLVMTPPGFAGVNGVINPNEFNVTYTGCEVQTIGAMTSFPDTTLAGIAGVVPYVFMGQNGTKQGPCLGVVAGDTFGLDVTAYTSLGE